MMKQSSKLTPELSRPLPVDRISAGGVAEHIVATPTERTALAERFGLLELLKCEANLTIDRVRGKMIEVTGTLNAEVVQQCVATLEPLPSKIHDTVKVLFAPPQMLDKGAGPASYEASEEECPEPIVDGIIDVGELVAQHLAIALDPYPRKAGLPPVAVVYGDKEGTQTKPNPFVTLVKKSKTD